MIDAMSDDDLITRACETNAAWLALGNDRYTHDGATFVRNRTTPHDYEANAVMQVRTGDLDTLIWRINREFTGYAHRWVDVDPMTPATVAERLKSDGYTELEVLYLVLEGALKASPRAIETRPVTSDSDWETYAALDRIWAAEQPAPWTAEAAVSRDLSSTRLKSPPARYWFAYADGAPRAFAASWSGANGVGIIEDIFTQPEYRRRGLATTLIARCVLDATDGGAGPIIIGADANAVARQIYESLGFRLLFRLKRYMKEGLA